MLAGQRARSFSFNFLFAGVASKNYGGHEEAKSHNACAKNDNEECNKGCDKEMHSHQSSGRRPNAKAVVSAMPMVMAKARARITVVVMAITLSINIEIVRTGQRLP